MNNRITTGYQYDLAGNLVRGQAADGSWQLMEYDSAGRMMSVKRESDGLLLQGNQYGSSRQRVASWNWVPESLRWYVWGGESVIAEYSSTSWGGLYTWVKSYIYAGSRLLSTATNNGAGGETLEFHHPDRLGTRMVTNASMNTSFEQSTLPFGTALPAESSGFSNQVFTSYDRSTLANLDYAVNRSYSPGQGRFTTVDPIGMASTSLGNPQSLNLYAYVQNRPTDFIDPTGLYTGCAHQAMTRYLTKLAGINAYAAQQISNYAGSAIGGADSQKYKANNILNWIFGSYTDIHFPTAEQLATGISRFQGFLKQGRKRGPDGLTGYQAAAFVLHAIQDGLGAHSEFLESTLGHAPQTVGSYIPNGIGGYVSKDPDTIIGDGKFIIAVNRTFQVLKNDDNATLTVDQLNELIDAIVTACGSNFTIHRPRPWTPRGGWGGGGCVAIDDEHGGGDLQIWTGVGASPIDVLTWEYSNRPPVITF